MPEENNPADQVDPLDQLTAEEEAAAQQGATAPQQEGQPQAAAQAAQPTQEQTAQEPEWRQQFETPEEMYDRLRNVQVNDGRQRNELGELRGQLEERNRQIAALTGQGQQPGLEPQAGPGGLPQLSEDDLNQWYDEDPVGAMRYISAEMAAQVAAMQQQQMQPIYESVHDAEASRAVERLKVEFGDDVVHRNREALSARVQADKDYFAPPETRHARLREALMAAEFEAQRSGRQQQVQQQARQPNGQFAQGGDQRTAYVEGGSTPAPSSGQADLDPIIAEIEATGVREDAYGAIPVHHIPG